MELSYGPDGGVFVLDWSDTGECHEYSGVHRTSGRIYKIHLRPTEPHGSSRFRAIERRRIGENCTRT